MALRFQVTVDCAEPDRLTRFWSAALSYKIEDPPGGFEGWNAYWRSVGVPEEELDDASDAGDSIVDADGAGPRIWFQMVPEGKMIKNRIHLDLDVSGGRNFPFETRKQRVDAAAARLADMGANRHRVLEPEGVDHYALVMQDPEANEFCIH